MPSLSDQNLLFGLLALQFRFVRREQLIAAVKEWLTDRSRPIEEILIEQGSLSESDRQLLAPLVARYVQNHSGDPQRSLASLGSIGSLADDLRTLADPDIDTTLTVIASDLEPGTPGATVISTHGSSGDRRAGRPTAGEERFHILRPHARGGLGEVYVARDTELNREVALKEIQERFADDESSRMRFLLEAEVTGGLEHPGIVPVYGLGRYEDGRPYYAMRFIRGDSLQEAAGRFHGLQEATGRAGDFSGVEFRRLLGRFVDVCEAIEYAHSRGVLHRDLKPGNIMLGKYGETLVVDWGLATTRSDDQGDHDSGESPLQPLSAADSAPTAIGSVIGTPAFMPPEQARGDLDAVGPASDVYSLGATLYFLLTGRAPFHAASVAEILEDVKAGRYPAPRSIHADVPTALEAVCRKAMSVQGGDRYARPQHLADEIEHYLADEPVTAMREPVSVRVRRWMRKHQTFTATTVATVLLSAVGLLAFSSVLSGKNALLSGLNSDLRDKSEALESSLEETRLARDEATSLNDFLTQDLLGQADPDRNPYQEKTTVVSLLDRAAVELEHTSAISPQPAVEATLRLVIGKTYFALGQWVKAERHLMRALSVRNAESGPQSPAALEALAALTDVQIELERFQAAEKNANDLEDFWTRAAGPDHAESQMARLKLSRILMLTGRYADAEAAARGILDRIATSDQYSDEVRLTARQTVADILSAQFRDSDAALALYEQNLESLRAGDRVESSHEVLTVKLRMVEHLVAAGRVEEAEQVCTGILQTRSSVTLPDDHPHTIMTRIMPGTVQVMLGKLNDGGRNLRTALQQARESLGENHATTWLARHALVIAALQSIEQVPNRQDVVDEAERLARENIEVCRIQQWPPEHSNTHESQTDLATALVMQEMVSRSQLFALFAVLSRSDRMAQARNLLTDLHHVKQQQLGSHHMQTIGSGMHLIQVRMLMDDTSDELRTLAAELRSAAENMPKGWPVHPILAQALGRLHKAAGRHSDAEPLFREYFEYSMSSPIATPLDRMYAISDLADCISSQGREQVIAEDRLLKGGTVYCATVAQADMIPLLSVRAGNTVKRAIDNCRDDESRLFVSPASDSRIDVSVIPLSNRVPSEECVLRLRSCAETRADTFSGTVNADSADRLISGLPIAAVTVPMKAGILYRLEVSSEQYLPGLWVVDSRNALLRWMASDAKRTLEVSPDRDDEYDVLIFPQKKEQHGPFMLSVREFSPVDEPN